VTPGPVHLTEHELQAWAREIGAAVPTPVVFALTGPLGAGKSVFARSLARGAGVRGPVPSPTYNLVLGYEVAPGRRVVHMDLYRLSSADEVFELGWDDWMSDSEAVILVEWAERAEPHLPRDRWTVRLSPVDGNPALRRVEWASVGTPPPLPEPRVGDAVEGR
jgi:tRNA threonylcarbamoyladenosine biosynthesis protein TsaE